MAQVLPAERDLRQRDRRRRAQCPTARSTASATTTCSSSTARSSCCAPTTSARSSTTARAGSARTRSSGTTRRCRPAPVYALDDEDWIFPSYRESAIGLLRGMPPRRCSPGGAAIRPAGGTRPTTTSRSICVPIATHVPHAAGLAWGKKLQRRARVRDRVLRRRRHLARARSTRARTSPPSCSAPLVLFCNNNQLGDLDAARRRRRAPRRSRTRRSATACPGVRVDGADVLAVLRGDARGGRARARAARARRSSRRVTVPRRAARDGRRPERVHRPRAGRGGADSASASAATRATCGARGPRRRAAPTSIRTEAARGDARRDRRGGGRAARRPGAAVRARATPIRPRRSSRPRRAAEDPGGG